MEDTRSAITWASVNNVVPLVGSMIVIALAFGALKSDVALINQKVDTMLTQQTEILTNVKELRADQSTLALKQKELETKWDMYTRSER